MQKQKHDLEVVKDSEDLNLSFNDMELKVWGEKVCHYSYTNWMS